MRSFSTLYKREFKKLLLPEGYRLFKSIFYKEVGQNVCLFVTAKKERHAPWYNVYFGIIHYCMRFHLEDLGYNDLIDEFQYELIPLMRDLSTKISTVEECKNYINTNLYADSIIEEETLEHIQSICKDIKDYILERVHIKMASKIMARETTEK